MKILRYSADDAISYGILEEDGTVRQLASCPFDSLEESGETTHVDSVRVLAPVGSPRLIGGGAELPGPCRRGGPDAAGPADAFHAAFDCSPRPRGGDCLPDAGTERPL